MLDNLTANTVTVITAVNGINHAKAYDNSTRGRAELEAECPAEVVQDVYKVWGDKPTVTEPKPVQQSAPKPSATDQQLAAMSFIQAQQANTITELQQANADLMLKIAGGNT